MEVIGNMDQTFDADAFIARIGKRLVEQFDDAKAATSPSTVGAAMEQPVRDQLQQILPRVIAVGSGFVIDSYGGTSRQTDVVLYEKDVCPVFSINNTPETTYYPCEGVIGVGEIKSTLDRQSLDDGFNKIASVKQLTRHVVHHPVPMPDSGKRPINTRWYGTIQAAPIITVMEGEEPAETAKIFGFVLAGDLRVKSETFCQAFQELAIQTGDQLSPNLVAVLSGGLLTWGNYQKVKHRKREWSDRTKGYVLTERTGNQTQWKPSWSATTANAFRYSREGETFRTLVRWILELYRTGATSDARAFDRYFQHEADPTSFEGQVVSKNPTASEGFS